MRTKPKGYWTKENCHKEALKFTTRTEFQKNACVAYNMSWRNSWLDDICAHMKLMKHKSGYWTYEKCKEIALQYEYASDFQCDYNGAYQKIMINGWLPEICCHFKKKGNLTKRFIYAYEFPDKSVYVGLTYNYEKRKIGHNKKGTVFNYIRDTNLKPAFKELTKEPFDEQEASKMEEKFVDDYRNEGWKILNKNKAGALGSSKSNLVKYELTLEEVKDEALKYDNKTSFSKGSSKAYRTALKNKWMDECCAHMISKRKSNGYWTKERCSEIALKFKNKADFSKNSGGAYNVAIKNNWIDEICSHMIFKSNCPFNQCLELIKQCKDIKEAELKITELINSKVLTRN